MCLFLRWKATTEIIIRTGIGRTIVRGRRRARTVAGAEVVDAGMEAREAEEVKIVKTTIRAVGAAEIRNDTTIEEKMVMAVIAVTKDIVVETTNKEAGAVAITKVVMKLHRRMGRQPHKFRSSSRKSNKTNPSPRCRWMTGPGCSRVAVQKTWKSRLKNRKIRRRLIKRRVKQKLRRTGLISSSLI